jgi:hypothetical protein
MILDTISLDGGDTPLEWLPPLLLFARLFIIVIISQQNQYHKRTPKK